MNERARERERESKGAMWDWKKVNKKNEEKKNNKRYIPFGVLLHYYDNGANTQTECV